MATQYAPALVLRLSDYSESSQIASLFSREHGLLRLIAKGVRRGTKTRFSPGLDLLELGELGFSAARSGGLGTLTDWTQKNSFRILRGTLVTLHAGLYAIQAVESLTAEHDPHPELFDGLLDCLARLETAAGVLQAAEGASNARSAALVAMTAFHDLLAANIGYAPHLGGCVDCGKTRAAGRAGWFSSSAGGLLCRDCEARHSEKRRASGAALEAVQEVAPLLERFELFQSHLERIAGRRIPTGDSFRRTCAGLL